MKDENTGIEGIAKKEAVIHLGRSLRWNTNVRMYIDGEKVMEIEYDQFKDQNGEYVDIPEMDSMHIHSRLKKNGLTDYAIVNGGSYGDVTEVLRPLSENYVSSLRKHIDRNLELDIEHPRSRV